MLCCHKYQKEKHHNENTKICILVHYMYAYTLFPLAKAIPIMFERLTTHYQILETRIGHNETRYHNFNTVSRILSRLNVKFIKIKY